MYVGGRSVYHLRARLFSLGWTSNVNFVGRYLIAATVTLTEAVCSLVLERSGESSRTLLDTGLLCAVALCKTVPGISCSFGNAEPTYEHFVST